MYLIKKYIIILVSQFIIPGYDPNTNQIVVRKLIFSGTSTSHTDEYGDFLQKMYINVGKKSVSSIVHSFRDIDVTDSKNIKVLDLGYKYNPLFKKHGCVIFNLCKDSLTSNNNLEINDCVTKKKIIFLAMGDLSDFFIKNPSMISEVINNKEHIEMQLKYLK